MPCTSRFLYVVVIIIQFNFVLIQYMFSTEKIENSFQMGAKLFENCSNFTSLFCKAIFCPQVWKIFKLFNTL